MRLFFFCLLVFVSLDVRAISLPVHMSLEKKYFESDVWVEFDFSSSQIGREYSEINSFFERGDIVGLRDAIPEWNHKKNGRLAEYVEKFSSVLKSKKNLVGSVSLKDKFKVANLLYFPLQNRVVNPGRVIDERIFSKINSLVVDQKQNVLK
ncbi:hypothetical protein [Pelagibaculum spongiae]|uniref:Uncharacterized protein n=1 Tax=Pelagibaculum spongiae TaxID=2080658 RepID=A0A2V1H4P2_9GAMM|nr:hypothetical protein [Pelagibaculum spongiae]PVZ71745.1 hypothetical protein DC094_01585 [Pelagibaculum spongiae]